MSNLTASDEKIAIHIDDQEDHQDQENNHLDLPDGIKMIDENKEMNLRLFAYIPATPALKKQSLSNSEEDHENNDSTTTTTNNNDDNMGGLYDEVIPDDMKSWRGVMYQGERRVLTSFPFCEEIVVRSVLDVHNALKKNGFLDGNITLDGDTRVYPSYEGTVLRLHYQTYQQGNQEGKWILSTHRKINAFTSRWGTDESFGSMAVRAMEQRLHTCPDDSAKEPDANKYTDQHPAFIKFCELLAPGCCYMFLLLTTNKNRIVTLGCDANFPCMLYLGRIYVNTTDNSEDYEYPDETDDLWPTSVPISSELDDDTISAQYIHDWVTTKCNLEVSQGLILYYRHPLGFIRQVKFINPYYYERYKIRGNEPSLYFRYLQVRMDKQLRLSLYALYSESHELFNTTENKIYDMAKHLLKMHKEVYVKSRKRNDNVKIAPSLQQFISACQREFHVRNIAVDLEFVITRLNLLHYKRLHLLVQSFLSV